MNTDSNKLLLNQWQTLHNSHEKYEHFALLIKLIAVICTLVAFNSSINTFAVVLLLAILCLQEGILKTFQSRAANAILAIENKMVSSPEESAEYQSPYLFYTTWQENRTSAIGLISEYIGNSLKPTVLYPYALLIIIILVL